MTNGDKFFQRLANMECSAGHMHIVSNTKYFTDRQCGTKNRQGRSCKFRLQKIWKRGRK